jgi:hypothetical protein
MSELDYECPTCGVQPGFRHRFTCDTRCRVTGLPLRYCQQTPQPEPHVCLTHLWCPPTSDGLIPVVVVDEDPQLENRCEQCQEPPRPGDVILLPRDEHYLFHLDCLISLVHSIETISDPRRTEAEKTNDAFHANKAALIAYLQRTSHDH